MPISEYDAHNKTVDDYYNDGFECGNTWLASGRWNFLHPYGSFTYANGHTIKGYIPGGPSVFVRASYGTKEYNEENKLADQKRKAWHNGWIDGINKYVRDNNLNYAQIPNER